MKLPAFARVVASFGTLFAQSAWAELPGLQNRWLEVRFQAGHGQLAKFVDRNAQWNHIETSTNTLGLWELEATVAGRKLTVSPESARQFRVQQRSSSDARLIWSGFTGSGLELLEVTAEVSLDSRCPSSLWNLQISAVPCLRLDRFQFPRLPGIRPQPNERLAAPLWMGQLCRAPRTLLAGHKPIRLEWEYPGLTSLQCLAYYQEQGPGFYLSCNDTNGYRKSFIFRGTHNGQVICELEHLPEHKPGAAYRLPYSVVLRGFVGDWFTAAEHYRGWATNQYWASQSRLARSAPAPWVTNTALWVWNRGRSPEVLAPAAALQQELGLPVSVFWHWWHGCAYDTGFPEYLPPREGTPSFTQALGHAKASGLHTIVYMNQRLWGMTTASWGREGASDFAVKGADGSIHPEVYNTFTRLPCASMCIGTPFWRNKYATIAATAFHELGVNGIYMDQACSSLACFDPSHNHPIGGGRYWVEGFHKMSLDLRARCSSPLPIVLAGEGCSEGWLPHLDLMLSLQVSKERYSTPQDGWEPIPFFQAVYHPYSILFGNYSSLTLPPYDDLWPAEFAPKDRLKLLDRKFSTQFRLEQSRAFLWGQQPAIANFLTNQLTERREEINYALRLAQLRAHHLKYLLHGTLLRPPQPRDHAEQPALKFPLSRLSIYAGQQGALTEFEGSSAPVLSAAWQAPNGAIAFFFVNLSDSTMTFPLAANSSDYPLRRRGRIFDATSDSRQQLGNFSQHQVSMSVAIPSRGVRVIELTK